MSHYLYACTNCRVTLAVTAARKLPNHCPSCESTTPSRSAVPHRLFEQITEVEDA